MPELILARVVSGGQTGVDRAALDVAIERGIPHGGWCPQGRKAEDGPIPDRYQLRETSSAQYRVRTEWNVRDSDGTLILSRGPLTGGTALTADFCEEYEKPVLWIDMGTDPESGQVADWLQEAGIRVLNVAGPRESTCPGIEEQAKQFLAAAFDRVSDA